MENAIKKAIEGGYNGIQVGLEFWCGIETKTAKEYPQLALLDPLFWQSLGKAMGWKEKMYIEGKGERNVKEWLEYWHNFIDHLAEGKDADSFFNELLK